MGYGTLAISGFRYWLGNLHGERIVQVYESRKIPASFKKI